MIAQEQVNILLVDDQPAKLMSYEVILAELGENLIKANSAREALEFLLKNDVAVVLVDVCMPELDGFEFLTELRCERDAPPVVVMTQYDDAANRQRALALGAARYVGKSHALDRGFVSTLRDWVGGTKPASPPRPKHTKKG